MQQPPDYETQPSECSLATGEPELQENILRAQFEANDFHRKFGNYLATRYGVFSVLYAERTRA